MKPNTLITIFCVTLLALTGATVFGQATATTAKSADALVKDLYKAHDQKRSPSFRPKVAHCSQSILKRAWPI